MDSLYYTPILGIYFFLEDISLINSLPPFSFFAFQILSILFFIISILIPSLLLYFFGYFIFVSLFVLIINKND